MGEIPTASNNKAETVISNALEEKRPSRKLFSSAPDFNSLAPVSAPMVLGVARCPGSSTGF